MKYILFLICLLPGCASEMTKADREYARAEQRNLLHEKRELCQAAGMIAWVDRHPPRRPEDLKCLTQADYKELVNRITRMQRLDF